MRCLPSAPDDSHLEQIVDAAPYRGAMGPGEGGHSPSPDAHPAIGKPGMHSHVIQDDEGRGREQAGVSAVDDRLEPPVQLKASPGCRVARGALCHRSALGA